DTDSDHAKTEQCGVRNWTIRTKRREREPPVRERQERLDPAHGDNVAEQVRDDPVGTDTKSEGPQRPAKVFTGLLMKRRDDLVERDRRNKTPENGRRKARKNTKQSGP